MIDAGDVQPLVIGGNGHSGTRVFNEIVTLGGVFTGIKHLTKRKESEDLRVLDLLNRWVGPYVFGTLDQSEMEKMKKALARRLRIYFPVRSKLWGFKNPRTLFILPLLDELFPEMKFVHVIRDGRDISLGNPFIHNNRIVDAYLVNEEMNLSPEEKMILFWGRCNQRAHEYGAIRMQKRYLMMRWEDLCTNPHAKSVELLQFASCPVTIADKAARLVRRPSSMGRWKTFPSELRDRVVDRGAPWLKAFGYS
jgi:hypothetical protein